MTKKATGNSTYKKLAVQLSFVSSSSLAGKFHLRNRQLLLAANRYQNPIYPFLTPTKLFGGLIDNH
jgi:hypothetical protein